jgi:type III secretion protein T
MLTAGPVDDTLQQTLQLTTFVEVVTLASARFFGVALTFPLLHRRQLSPLHQAAACLGMSAFQWPSLWHAAAGAAWPAHHWVALVLKEAVLGFFIGCLVTIPFWVVLSAFTLLDNQRGANAAQMANPSLQADASMLGELGERALIAAFVEGALHLKAFEFMCESFTLWPAASEWPPWTAGLRGQAMLWFVDLLANALAFSAPVLLLLLLIEVCMAVASLAVQGLNVYQLAMPIKSSAALLLLAVMSPRAFEWLLAYAQGSWHQGMATLMQMSR